MLQQMVERRKPEENCIKQSGQMHGFALKSTRKLAELDAQLHEFLHEKSGARLIWLDRPDENKTFGIAFTTLPEDDSGVFHILEHSVFCGSERYPVKDPFVELKKSSLQTFLNAMTFPDKTFYPVSSRNTKDFVNLIRVYMDAVLYPRITKCPEIFAQEGWHYELDEAGCLRYKGVVLNEMKGAFASPGTLLQNEIKRRLFPDTPYRFISGGDPVHITQLSYERFLEVHQQFYHPSNAYIILDGQVNLQQILEILDCEYLSNFTLNKDRRYSVPMQKPVRSPLVRVPYEISPDELPNSRGRLAWGFVPCDFQDRETWTAVCVLAYALCGSNQAPLKKRLFAEGLAENVKIGLMDGILQPVVTLEVQNIDTDNVAEVERAVWEEINHLCHDGLDHTQIAAILANKEFQMRERNYGGTPRGLVFSLDILKSWIYGGDPAANLEMVDLFASLNQKLESRWFEHLLERVFLHNNHTCEVLLFPSPALGAENRAAQETKLQKIREGMNAETLASLRAHQNGLLSWQSGPDSPNALASVPKLELSDVSDTPQLIPMEQEKLAGRPLLLHRIPTGGISYGTLYFDISDFPQESLSEVSFLCTILGSLEMTDHDPLELQKQFRLHFGNVRFGVEAYSPINQPDVCRTNLCVSFSTLDSKLKDAVSLLHTVLTAIRFDDIRKIQEVLRQERICAEQSIIESGSSVAMTRIAAGHSAEGVVQEHSGGFAYYQWLKAQEQALENGDSKLPQVLVKLCQRIFVKNRLTVSITGTNDYIVDALKTQLVSCLPDCAETSFPCAVRPWGRRREGIVIPSDVSFAAMGGNLLSCGGVFNGVARVLCKAVSLTYLWNTIRVQGGAYGTGLTVGDSGNICFYSYRDPGAAQSLKHYRRSADFVEQFCANTLDLTGFILGTVAESDPLMLPPHQGKFSDILYFKGVSDADRCTIRKTILTTTSEQLRTFIQPLRVLSAEGSVCVVGSRHQLDACGEEIEIIHSL